MADGVRRSREGQRQHHSEVLGTSATRSVRESGQGRARAARGADRYGSDRGPWRRPSTRYRTGRATSDPPVISFVRRTLGETDVATVGPNAALCAEPASHTKRTGDPTGPRSH